MWGLIIKDFINLKKNLKIFAILIIFYGVLSFIMNSSSYFGSMFTLVFALMYMNTYSFDEMAKWDGYALTMPVTKESLIRSKYAMMLLVSVIGFAISSIMIIILNILLIQKNFFSGLEICSLGAAAVILFYCIGIPIITKLGIEKSRYILIAVYAVPFFIGYMGYKALRERYPVPPEKLVKIGEFLLKNAFLLVPLVLIIALAVSYSISIAIYRKKEF